MRARPLAVLALLCLAALITPSSASPPGSPVAPTWSLTDDAGCGGTGYTLEPGSAAGSGRIQLDPGAPVLFCTPAAAQTTTYTGKFGSELVFAEPHPFVDPLDPNVVCAPPGGIEPIVDDAFIVGLGVFHPTPAGGQFNELARLSRVPACTPFLPEAYVSWSLDPDVVVHVFVPQPRHIPVDTLFTTNDFTFPERSITVKAGDMLALRVIHRVSALPTGVGSAGALETERTIPYSAPQFSPSQLRAP